MTRSDSTFLVEVSVENLTNHGSLEDFLVKARFADIFSMNLNTKSVNAIKKKGEESLRATDFMRSGASIIRTENVNKILIYMKMYPIELTMWNKSNIHVASANIPWRQRFINYVNNLNHDKDMLPVALRGKYKIFSETTSKCMASLTLHIKLSYLRNNITSKVHLPQEIINPLSFSKFKTSELITMTNRIQPKEIHKQLQQPGIIRTIYSEGKNSINHSRKKVNSQNYTKTIPDKMNKNNLIAPEVINRINMKSNTIHKSTTNFVERDTGIYDTKNVTVTRCKSHSMLLQKQNRNLLNYVFWDRTRPFGNQTYYIGYCTVHNGSVTSPLSSNSPQSSKAPSKNNAEETKEVSDAVSLCSLHLPIKAAELITANKCKNMECNFRRERSLPGTDDKILLDLSDITTKCCAQKTEEVVGGVTAKMQVGPDPCFCSCECTFGFVKKTTYCGICGGYEKAGDDITSKPVQELFPCPIFHKLLDKNKSKMGSSGSDIKKKIDDTSSHRSLKTGVSASDKRSEKKSVESEKDSKKGKSKRIDDRFKFHYGYKAPQIGHSHCVSPCTGSWGGVPKNMGWLWTADNVPGLKFRPNWRPGATHKQVVRLLKIAKNPGELKSKKRRRDSGKKKALKRPLLVVHKKDGEFTVTMEPMKQFTKPRAINQYPYEDRPVLTYTIGRTDEENNERQKKKERSQRRLERAQRAFIQSAFKNMCEEICIKTYQQALGILPDAEEPTCPCYPADPHPKRTNMDVSCSCSQASTSITSDTDDDEWIVEFTPPNATFDPKFKSKKVQKHDNFSQYNFMDYRVMLVDRLGNPVPRFFKGPDGRQQCSDLGGFWSTDHKWLEINVDGFVAPDGRWAPMHFIGPNGEQVEAEKGKFQAANGDWLVIGVDGYVDYNGKWRTYPRPKCEKHKITGQKRIEGTSSKKDWKGIRYKPSEATWSCFGDISPRELSKMGIVGHGLDKKLLISTLKALKARGIDVNFPAYSTIPRGLTGNRGRQGVNVKSYDSRNYFLDRKTCHHHTPSEKGIVAVDGRGNKTYFRLKNYKNKRPKDRIQFLKGRGISVSSFHVPCFHSFINSELMKQQLREKLLNRAQSTNVATQADF